MSDRSDGTDKAPMLYDLTRHEALRSIAWDASRAHAAIDEIVRDAESHFTPGRYWPLHPRDLAPGDDPNLPSTTLYFGACGVIWALHYLQARGAARLERDYLDTLEALREHNRAWLASIQNQDFAAYLMGDTPIRMLAYGATRSETDAQALADLIDGNREHPSRELMWGAPGTLLAALCLLELTGDERWAARFRDTAAVLWSQLEWSAIHECAFWTQDLYGHRTNYLDAVHGFVATAAPILRGAHLLATAEREAWLACIGNTVQRSITRDGELANWRVFLDTPAGREPLYLMQFCHGAPGFVICLADHPDVALDELLLAAGETIWRAGPLTKGANLCHGTGGNGYAFLKLYRRSGDPRWLDRARAFAMHGIEQVAAEHDRYGHGRYSLWTGDIGFAIYLWDCLHGDADFPTLDVFYA
ncbi:LanC-like protein [Niveibacterium sp.]|uniref:lanthionine synthetase C family protein n=1 Tax=Niveibacterium sp. TaxID=2017444 RepID=UPI0035B4229A